MDTTGGRPPGGHAGNTGGWARRGQAALEQVAAGLLTAVATDGQVSPAWTQAAIAGLLGPAAVATAWLTGLRRG